MSIVLDDVLSANYEPSEGELLEYGKWLGMDFPADKPFLWIAREGLKAPLPENWKACRSDKGDLYYFNFKTGESIWDHPMDEHFRELLLREKETPGPQSVANGAQKKPSMLQTVTKGATENTTLADQKHALSLGATKMQTLKLLKRSKRSTEEPRPDPEGRKSSCSDTSSRSFEESILAASTIDVNCMTSKSSTAALSSTKESDSLSSKREAFLEELSDQLRHFQDTKLREYQSMKDEYEVKLRESWAQSQKHLEEEHKRKINLLKEGLEKKFSDEKSRLEREYTVDIQQLRSELASQFEMEAKRMREHLSDKHKREEEDADRRWHSEIKELTRERNIDYEKLSALNNRINEEMKRSTKELEKNAAEFIETYRKSHTMFSGVLIEANATYSKQCETILVQFINCAKETYETEIANLKGCYLLEIENIKGAFVEDALGLQQKIRDLKEEKQLYENETVKVSREELESLNIESADLREFCTPKQGVWGTHKHDQMHIPIDKTALLFPQTQGYGKPVVSDVTDARSEKEVFQKNMASMKETQIKELENAKMDLRRHTEDEIRSALDEIVRERRYVLREPNPEKMDETLSLQRTATVPADLKGDGKELEGCIEVSSGGMRKDDLAALFTAALRAVLLDTPSIISPSIEREDVCGKPPNSLDTNVKSHEITTDGVNLERHIVEFPVSFRGQKTLLASERQRIGDEKKIVENQRISLEKRRSQLKETRHQWKLDVMAAKHEGVRSSSRRGQLLNKVRLALDSQSKGLEHDEAILCESERWLLSKEQMVDQMEQQIRDLEGERTHDMSTNSIDTIALTRDFFMPKGKTADIYSQPQHGSQRTMQTRSLSPICTKTLDKIARRLDEVTSMMNLQHQKRGVSVSCERMQRRRSEHKSTRG